MDSPLDSLMNDVLQHDTHARLQAGAEIQDYLNGTDGPVHCENWDKLVDGLSNWISSSNYKVSIIGLECLTSIADKRGERFKIHLATVLPPVIDRLGDSKDQVRDQAQSLIQKAMQITTPQCIFEKLTRAFSHKNFRVREEILLCLMQTINIFGANSLTLNKLVPTICKLLGDPNSQVRDTAINSLVEIYRHVGEKVRIDLGKKGIPSSRLSIIYAKFDEVKRSGRMIAVADGGSTASRSSTSASDETDSARVASAGAGSSHASRSRPNSTLKKSITNSGGGGAGSVDEEAFLNAFEEVPSVTIFNAKSLDDDMSRINETLSNDKNAWDTRVNTLKKLRGLVVAGALDYDCFMGAVKQLETPLNVSTKDLRSQVVREACITIAFLTQKVGKPFDHNIEYVMPALFNLISNSAKIMATSALVCLNLVLATSRGYRLIPIVCSYITSKSAVIRKHTCYFLITILTHWDRHSLERHLDLLEDTIKKGLEDASSEARSYSRQAYWELAKVFQSRADRLMASLDPSKQKLLNGGAQSRNASHENLSFGGRNNSASSSATGSRRVPQRSQSDAYKLGPRSNSDINTSAASRAKSRHTSANTNSSPNPVSANTRLRSTSRENLGSTDSPDGATRHRRVSGEGSRIPTPARGRSSKRVGVSQSQPSSRSSSRSGSPSRGGGLYGTYGRVEAAQPGDRSGRVRRKSAIPRSQGCSREASPSRLGFGRDGGRHAAAPGNGHAAGHRGRSPGQGKNILTQQVLQPGMDVEEAFADALKKAQQRRRWDSYGSTALSDEESDASSICSVGSYGSGGGPGRSCEDVVEVLNKCASPSWAERKEGLLGLAAVLHGSRVLTPAQLKRATEIFTRMFSDPHGKVFSLFLETLPDFVSIHKVELQDWLYVLLTRLLHKMGADLLGSVQAKIHRALDIVRDSFPYDKQYAILIRFIVDQTQTPNTKVKVALLVYMEQMLNMMDTDDFINSGESRLAVSRIIGWTKEAKSLEVRKASQAALISLFELNTSKFSMMLSSLPKTYQDSATKLLHTHLKNTANNDNENVPPKSKLAGSANPPHHSSPRGSALSPKTASYQVGMDAGNMNDFYNSLKETTAEIQNYTNKQQRLDTDDADADQVSSDSGLPSDSPDGALNAAALSPTSPAANLPQPAATATATVASASPAAAAAATLSSNSDTPNQSALAEAIFDDDEDDVDDDDDDQFGEAGSPDSAVTSILRELSNHNHRFKERTEAMSQLIKMAKDTSNLSWTRQFRTILYLLIETLGDSEYTIRAMSLRVMREILRNVPDRFREYAELTIMKILEAHKDSQKEVVRAAEEVSATLAACIPTDLIVRVLAPIIHTADYPVNLAAIKMLTKVLERMNKQEVNEVIHNIIPGLLKNYDHSESSVRKASVFSLVSVHNVIGDDLTPHLSALSGSKIKLLNLYIKRAQTEKPEGQ